MAIFLMASPSSTRPSPRKDTRGSCFKKERHLNSNKYSDAPADMAATYGQLSSRAGRSSQQYNVGHTLC